eukprot:5297199-Prymnesium_polylepis.1
MDLRRFKVASRRLLAIVACPEALNDATEWGELIVVGLMRSVWTGLLAGSTGPLFSALFRDRPIWTGSGAIAAVV